MLTIEWLVPFTSAQAQRELIRLRPARWCTAGAAGGYCNALFRPVRRKNCVGGVGRSDVAYVVNVLVVLGACGFPWK